MLTNHFLFNFLKIIFTCWAWFSPKTLTWLCLTFSLNSIKINFNAVYSTFGKKSCFTYLIDIFCIIFRNFFKNINLMGNLLRREIGFFMKKHDVIFSMWINGRSVYKFWNIWPENLEDKRINLLSRFRP